MSLPNPYIALVDDEVLVRRALGRLLRLADFKVSAFPSGEAFLAALDERHPDCIVLDVHMPGLSGLDVQARLRAAHIKIPVVFMTAVDDLALGQGWKRQAVRDCSASHFPTRSCSTLSARRFASSRAICHELPGRTRVKR